MKKNYLNLCVLFFSFTIFVSIIGCGDSMSKAEWQNIEKNGTETSGVVVSKSINETTINNSTITKYVVKFDFYHKDSLILASISKGRGEDMYDKAQIGMRYKVKYIYKGKETSKSAIIFVDSPLDAYKDSVKKELERIRKMYEK